jgi:biotin carboxylase
MEDVAERTVLHLGLDHTMFNIELIFEPASDRIHIIEINPRLCGQFADLYRKVDGTSGYEVALALAAGDEPRVRRNEGPYRMATSFPLRTFTPVRLSRAPTPADHAAAEALFERTLVWLECAEGADLSDFEAEDGWSTRYAVVNLGADSRAGLRARLDAVAGRLGFEFEAL